MFQNINTVSYINGENGIYNSKINNNSVRYARNAFNNFKDAYSQERIDKYSKPVQETYDKLQVINKEIDEMLKQSNSTGVAKLDKDLFDKKIKATQEYSDALGNFTENLPESKFSLRYAQNKPGEPDKMAVMGAAYEELDKRTSVDVDELTDTIRKGISDKNKQLFSADSLDLNKDGKVDIAEYGSSILAEDMLSTNQEELKAENITGEITQKGQNSLLAFAAINNYNMALNTYKSIHSSFNLEEAQKEFLKDKNNLI